MLVSRCCKYEIYVLTDYYICALCHLSTNPICVLNLSMEAATKSTYDKETEAQF